MGILSITFLSRQLNSHPKKQIVSHAMSFWRCFYHQKCLSSVSLFSVLRHTPVLAMTDDSDYYSAVGEDYTNYTAGDNTNWGNFEGGGVDYTGGGGGTYDYTYTEPAGDDGGAYDYGGYDYGAGDGLDTEETYDDFYGSVRRKAEPEEEPQQDDEVNIGDGSSPSSPSLSSSIAKSPLARKKSILRASGVKEVGVPMETDATIAEDIRVLRTHYLFRDVFWNDFYKLATRCFVRFKIPKDTVLARQGSTKVGGTHFCVITKGLVDVIRSEVVLTTLGVGDGFGEQQLLYSQPAAATLVCHSYVEAWGIDRSLLLRIKSGHQFSRRRRTG